MYTLLLHLFLQNLIELPTKVVEEEGINHLVDVLNRGVVHTTTTTGLRIQRALEYSTEDGR